MFATPPPPAAPPALVYNFDSWPGFAAGKRLGVMVKCTGWTASVIGLTVPKSQVAAVKVVLEQERKVIATGAFGFRTQADRCNQKQAEAAVHHATRALRAHGIS